MLLSEQPWKVRIVAWFTVRSFDCLFVAIGVNYDFLSCVGRLAARRRPSFRRRRRRISSRRPFSDDFF